MKSKAAKGISKVEESSEKDVTFGSVCDVPCLSLSHKMSENIRSTLLITSFLRVLISVYFLLCKIEMLLKPAPSSGGKDWLSHMLCP